MSVGYMSKFLRFVPRCTRFIKFSTCKVTVDIEAVLQLRNKPLSSGGCLYSSARMSSTAPTQNMAKNDDSCQNVNTDVAAANHQENHHSDSGDASSMLLADPAGGDAEKSPGQVQDSQSIPQNEMQHMPDDDWHKLSRRAKKRIFRQKKIEAAKLNKKLKKEKSAKNSKDPNFTMDCLKETDYYIENGLRKVYPYYFDFTTYAKGRWVGQTLIDIFMKEFRNDTPENYRKVIEAGKVKVNFKPVSVDYKLKNNDYIENTVHRHEMPVTADPIEIVEDNEKVLVINKPSSIPIHPCGRYRHNSLTYILGKQYGYKDFRTIYRLDRLTSGLMIFPKSEELTRTMQNAIKSRKVEKEYVCRVIGEFPEEVMECLEPVDVLSHTMGIFHVDAQGKEASTTFKRMFYDSKSKTSVVRCFPHTGRTHQIRIHLQWLGYPIVNDPIYNSEVWGPERGKAGKFGKSKEQLIHDLLEHHSAERYLEMDDDAVETPGEQRKSTSNTANDSPPSRASPSSAEICRNTTLSTNFPPQESPSAADIENDLSDGQPSKKLKLSTSEPTEMDHVRGKTPASQSKVDNLNSCSCPGTDSGLLPFDESKSSYDAECTECQRKYHDPQPKDLVMYLHARRYKGPDWEYSTTVPAWAEPEWQEAS